MAERIDKVLSHKGFGSRKEVKKYIKNKCVLKNGELITYDNEKVNEGDIICVNDISFVYTQFVYIMLHKPAGVISATQDLMHSTVLDLLDDHTTDLFPVGRLDKDTEGLCLISNDGQLAHRLLSNKKHVAKVYEVHTEKVLSASDFSKIEEGLLIDNDEKCLPAHIIKKDDYYLLTITEGKYHQIKRMMQALNNQVTYLKRLEMGPLKLDETLLKGEYRYLTESEIKELLK